MIDFEVVEKKAKEKTKAWREDWRIFARQALGVYLDKEQENILQSVQFNPRTSVVSGTARGKDFVASVASICFLYLTPKWKNGELIENTKVALTAPTGRQIINIMQPEFARLFNRAHQRGVDLPGRLVSCDIRTNYSEWFLTGFKADEYNHEAWTGFHAVNTMFTVTEASGISDSIYQAIEGNLQGNSRILIVFNPNNSVGYAAKSQKSERWAKFRLNSLTAPNVIEKNNKISGQVDYNWICDKINEWCDKIEQSEVNSTEDDFEFEGQWYRPSDLFRVKVLGLFPKVSEDTLIPSQWIEEAFKRHNKTNSNNKNLKIGVDVAGMGRDNSVYCFRYENYISKFKIKNSAGKADHMAVAGDISNEINQNKNILVFVDTIGEGAGVYSRLIEQNFEENVYSCKYSEAARDLSGRDLTDITGQYKFANMRAYLFWAVRDWFNPANNFLPALPELPDFLEEASEIKYYFRSDGKIIIEPKEDIKSRLGRSTDIFDALANTFYPNYKRKINYSNILNSFK